MKKLDYSELNNVSTPQILVKTLEKSVVFEGNLQYMDADDELLAIANFIKENTDHNSDINPERIKYLYTTLVKKDGGRYVLGGLKPRSEEERMINDEYDYILSVHYKSWKELDIENKVILLDKILCGVDVDLNNKVKKQAVDVKEYDSNLKCYGVEKSLNSSEIIDMAIDRIISEEKEERKNKKDKKGQEDDE